MPPQLAVYDMKSYSNIRKKKKNKKFHIFRNKNPKEKNLKKIGVKKM